MTQASLQSLHIYPIKSSAGIEISSSWVEEYGLSFDRRFVVAQPNGEFITARTQPKLCLIQANITATGLILTAPNMVNLTINYQELAKSYINMTIWQDRINAQQCLESINQWFSRYLMIPCQLLFFGEQSQRFVKQKNSQVAFADGYPLLLISQASLDSLNSYQPKKGALISMAQFRPNLVVNNCAAFAEDTWQRIRIGSVEFEVTKPCTRCIFTTVNPLTGEKHPKQEPLTTLKNYRQLANGDILFGQNLVALNQGQIRRNDKVEVINTQAAPIFSNKSPKKHNVNNQETRLSNAKSKPLITFSSYNKTITGNNSQTILEQGEDAGLILSYSCRGGMCGSCKTKLEQGDVEQLSQDGLSDEEIKQGYILSCSCIPLTDVVLSHPERKRNHTPED